MRLSIFLLLLILPSTAVEATDVRFNTTFGEFEVELFDLAAPNTVANFLNYVSDGDYQDSIVHRSVPDFVIQGGGFYPDASRIPADPPIVNESSFSNLRGTISMATLGGDPDSATSQWFINLVDNPFLDTQGGGFTVFGVVKDMTIPDAVSALSIVDATSISTSWRELPVLDASLSSPELTAPSNLFRINSITVVPEPSAALATAFSAIFALLRRRSL